MTNQIGKVLVTIVESS
ncbi:hypothetical protein LINPERHAP1_LOCUS9078 [Linum perenne]